MESDEVGHGGREKAGECFYTREEGEGGAMKGSEGARTGCEIHSSPMKKIPGHKHCSNLARQEITWHSMAHAAMLDRMVRVMWSC